jgi:P4 family phage/plasmid primase-like protien
LRDGNVLPHGMLMRNQTAVAPNFRAMVEGYEQHCPRWMAYLNFIADGRDDVIPFLRRWGGGSFVGTIFELYFLFIHGLSGTGKTVYLDVLSRLAHLYGTPVSKGFFMRSLEKRTFELYQTFKKRAVFSDEVPKGSTWDEMMLLTMLNGSELHAEGKGKAFLKFRSVASITITGNHRPAFVTSAEESGIDRRLLVLECNKKIAEHMPDNTRFAREVVEEEGPSILAFFIQAAMEGWQSLERTGSFYGDTVKSLVEAARGYRRAANPFLQWIKEDMEQGEGVGFDYESKDAFKDFVAHMREQNPRYHLSKEDFRNGLEALGFKYGQRTQGQNLGRLVFKGFRPKPVDDPFGNDDGAGNIVKFPKPEQK